LAEDSALKKEDKKGNTDKEIEENRENIRKL